MIMKDKKHLILNKYKVNYNKHQIKLINQKHKLKDYKMI